MAADPTSLRSSANRTIDGQRKAHHKVKTGCRPCKRRRRKCDEQKPICSGCARHSTDCDYPAEKELGVIKISHPPTSSSINARSAATASWLDGAPASPLQSLNLADLELFHQYLTSTCIATSQLPEVTVQIQRTEPQLGQEYPFVMHGILAKAAIQLSWLRPSQQRHYAVLAAKHHGTALPHFRSTLQNINEKNHSALMSYSKGLVWCAFARHEASSTNEPMLQSTGDVDWLPEWFYLLRGSCLVVEFCRRWIKDGLHIVPQIDSASEFFLSPDNDRITALMTISVPPNRSTVCGSVVSALRDAFALASMSHHNTPLRNALNFWVGVLPDEYVSWLQTVMTVHTHMDNTHMDMGGFPRVHVHVHT